MFNCMSQQETVILDVRNYESLDTSISISITLFARTSDAALVKRLKRGLIGGRRLFES